MSLRAAGIVTVACACLALAGTAAASPSKVVRKADAPAAQLDRISTTVLPGTAGVVYRYQQEAGGVPVLDAQAVVHDYPGAPAELVGDSTAGDVPAPPAPSVTRAEAIRAALASVGTSNLRAPVKAALAIAPREGDAQVWNVSVPSAAPFGDFEVLVDAASGEVRSQRNLRQDAMPTARIFLPNAVVANGGYSKLGRRPKADHHDHNTHLLTQLRSTVSLEDLDGDQNCLKGDWASVKLGGKHKDVCRASHNWNSVKRAGNKFEALMAYYHVDRMQAYVQSLGFAGATGINNESQKLYPDATRDDNSFYLPFNDTITWGTGGVDDAEDEDVIVHEYGHAMQDDQVNGFGADPSSGALGEGFGDYLAASQTQRDGGSTEAQRCIFDWDGVGGWGSPPPKPCGRRADDERTFHQAQTGTGTAPNYCDDPSDVHCVGQPWASALMDIRTSLPDEPARALFDADVFGSQFDYTVGEGFPAAATPWSPMTSRTTPALTRPRSATRCR